MAEAQRYERVFLILEKLAAAPNGMSLSAIAKAVGMPLSTCHDVLKGLTNVGAVRVAHDSKQYRLGRRSRELARHIGEALPGGRSKLDQLPPAASFHLFSLARTLGFDVYFAVLEYGVVSYTERFRGTRPVNINVPLGQSLSLYGTAAGKLFASYETWLAASVLDAEHPLRQLTPWTIVDRDELRAEYERTAARGWSQTRGEAIRGVSGLAVPVMIDGALRGAVHVSALSTDLPDPEIPRVIGQMRATADAVAAELR